MKKNVWRTLLVLVLCCSLVLNVFAATVTTENEDGTTTTTTVTETTTTENGETVVVVNVQSNTTGTNNEGAIVNGEETYQKTTVTDENGDVVRESWTESGSETKEWTEKDYGDVPGQTEVSVGLKPGETTTGTVTSTTITDNVTDNEDISYDYTTTTTTDRTVTATTSTKKTTINDAEDGLVGKEATGLKGIAPVYDENDDVVYGSNGKILDKHGKQDVFDRNYLSATNADPSKWVDAEGNSIVPDGADFRYVGTGEHGKFYNARVTVIYAKDEAGNTLFDENGNPIIESIQKRDGTIITIDGVPATEVPDGVTLEPIYDDYNGGRPTTFMLMDVNGNRVFAYCCDMQTGAVKGEWYSFSNLEDSDYYASEESEEHIRSIVMNGYWGTSDIPDEEGNYELGSLERMKEGLREAITSGKMENEVISVPVLDADGNPVLDEAGNPVMESKTMLELIDDLTEGEALLATQAAIWAYSNGSLEVQSGKDGEIQIDPDGYKWNHDPNVNSKDGEALDDFGSARVDFLYNWLINLETEEESTVVINDKNFVDDMSLTIGDKVQDNAANLDDNTDNDVYNASLNFKLAFIPGANDDLLVRITYTDLDGNPVNIVRRLAGVNDGEESYLDIYPEADGTYVLSGLKLSENEDFDFDLRLEGTQYLENGVYVYAPVGGRDVSQTFVGIAEGERNVDVSVGVTISFDVDENNHVVAERKWQAEADPVIPDPEGTVDIPGGNNKWPEPPTNNVTEDDGLEEIEEEEVPLADVPDTGDSSIVFIVLAILSACGLAYLALTKKQEEK